MPPLPPDIIRDTVRETLSGLGFDLKEPNQLQADIHYLRRLRKGSEDITRILRHSALTVLFTTTIYLLWEQVKTIISHITPR